MDTKGPNASTDLTQRFALDVQGFDSMRAQAAASPQQSLQTVAKQFDAVFLQMMLKSMREATPQDGPMDSRDEAQFTSMLDEQMAQQMSSKGVGVADALIRQLSRNAGLPSALPVGSAGGAASAGGAEGMLRALSGSQDGGSGDAGSTAMMSALARAYSNKTANGALANDKGYSAASAYTPPTRGNGTSSDVDAFVEKMAAPAQTASDATGIPARFIIGQAALESGWGHGEIRYPNGAPSHNVFGIKATKDWTGKTVASVTTEYVNGEPQKTVQRFRAYDSYAQAMTDYANVMRSNPRYASVLSNSHDPASFAHEMQRAGYATDPHYAKKLMSVMQQMS